MYGNKFLISRGLHILFKEGRPLLLLAALTPPLSTAIDNANSSSLKPCLESSALNMLQSISNTTNVTSSIIQGLAQFSSTCLGVAVQKPIRIMVPLTGSIGRWQKRAKEYEARFGVPVVLDPVMFYLTARELLLELSSSPIHDGWIFDPTVQGAAAAMGGFADLGPLIRGTQQETLWSDFMPYYREVSSVHAKRTIAIPLDGDLFLMYYRADLFTRYNLEVPQTWDDFLDIARRMNGTDTDGDGKPDLLGACFDMLLNCKGSFLVPAVAGSYIQYKGTSHGMWFDPDSIPDLKPLVNNPAMAAVLTFWKDIMPYTNPTKSCSGSNADFQAGRCLMTVNWGDEFRAVPVYNISKLGMVGLAPLPGSTQVLDRNTNALVDCTPDLCPYSRPYIKPRSRQQAWVNTAPFPAFGGWSGAVSAMTTPEQQQSVLDFYLFMTNPTNSWADVLDAESGVDPFREQHVQDVDRWIRAGYERNLVTSYLQTIKDSLNSKNVLLDTRLAYDPTGGGYRLPFEIALYNVTQPDAPLDAVSRAMRSLETLFNEAKLGAITKSRSGDPIDLAQQYWDIIGQAGSVRDLLAARHTPATTLASGTSSDSDKLTIAVATSLSVIIAIAILATLFYVLQLRKQQHRSLLGKVLAPGAGPNTTLVITDVQDSTSLYEALPVSCMDKCMQLTCSIIRSLLYKNNGYESATEGDSFIIAFHTANEAVVFCIELQEALLHAEWPEELLQTEGCDSVHPVWVTSTELATTCKRMLHVSWDNGPGTKSRSILRVMMDKLCWKAPEEKEDVIPATDDKGDAFSFHQEQPYSNSSFSEVASSLGDADVDYQFKPVTEEERLSIASVPMSPGPASSVRTAPSDCGSVGKQGGENASITRAKQAKLNGAQPSDASTVRQLAMRAWTLDSDELKQINRSAVSARSEPPVRVFQGLRVRCAIHSGPDIADEAVYSKAAGSVIYSGAFLEATKVVESCAHGGQVLMSRNTFNLLVRAKLPPGVLLLHLGEHLVDSKVADLNPATSKTSEGDDDPADQHLEGLHLYTALYASSAPRLALLKGPRTDQTLTLGALDAPIGTVTIGFLKVVGMSDIKAWNAQEANAALTAFSSIVKETLEMTGGYLVEHVDGFVLVAFTSAMNALKFAVNAQQSLMNAPWSARLLKYALTEELAVSQVDARGQPHKVILMRGPRIKAGFDTGATRSQVHPTTGRMAYRGKVMNRAARIQAVAASGQILCSSEAWSAANAVSRRNMAIQASGLICSLLGELQLKGIKDKLEIYQVHADSKDQSRIMLQSFEAR